MASTAASTASLDSRDEMLLHTAAEAASRSAKPARPRPRDTSPSGSVMGGAAGFASSGYTSFGGVVQQSASHHQHQNSHPLYHREHQHPRNAAASPRFFGTPAALKMPATEGPSMPSMHGSAPRTGGGVSGGMHVGGRSPTWDDAADLILNGAFSSSSPKNNEVGNDAAADDDDDDSNSSNDGDDRQLPSKSHHVDPWRRSPSTSRTGVGKENTSPGGGMPMMLKERNTRRGGGAVTPCGGGGAGGEAVLSQTALPSVGGGGCVRALGSDEIQRLRTQVNTLWVKARHEEELRLQAMQETGHVWAVLEQAEAQRKQDEEERAAAVASLRTRVGHLEVWEGSGWGVEWKGRRGGAAGWCGAGRLAAAISIHPNVLFPTFLSQIIKI